MFSANASKIPEEIVSKKQRKTNGEHTVSESYQPLERSHGNDVGENYPVGFAIESHSTWALDKRRVRTRKGRDNANLLYCLLRKSCQRTQTETYRVHASFVSC